MDAIEVTEHGITWQNGKTQDRMSAHYWSLRRCSKSKPAANSNGINTWPMSKKRQQKKTLIAQKLHSQY